MFGETRYGSMGKLIEMGLNLACRTRFRRSHRLPPYKAVHDPAVCALGRWKELDDDGAIHPFRRGTDFRDFREGVEG